MSTRHESPFAYLRRVRRNDGWSLTHAERVLGLDTGYLARLEAGESGLPSLTLLEQMARLYAVPLPEFWAGLGLHDEAQAADWRPRRGDAVLVEGRDRADVLLSDSDERMALVRTRTGEEVRKAWSVLEPVAAEKARAA